MPDPIPTTPDLVFYINPEIPDTAYTENPVPQPAGPGDPVGFYETRGSNPIPMVQPTEASRPIISDINGEPALLFDGVDDFELIGEPGDFNILHNTSGFTVALAIEKAQADPGNVAMEFIDTCGRNSLNVGLSIYYDNRTVIPAVDRLGVYIGRGVSGEAFRNLQSADGALAGTGPFCIVVSFDGTSTVTARVNGIDVPLPNVFGAFGTPSTADHTFPLTQCKNAAGSTAYFHGKKMGVAIFSAAQPTGNIEAIEAEMMGDLGIL
ncbi:MAG: hypothetical protein KME14_26100 [Tildeniella torsiva UHER 1998/13D]|jgi:hypothetical protein|nr:hypothetical protein [Tildeniella torsiva UHER 1998/13D]